MLAGDVPEARVDSRPLADVALLCEGLRAQGRLESGMAGPGLTVRLARLLLFSFIVSASQAAPAVEVIAKGIISTNPANPTVMYRRLMTSAQMPCRSNTWSNVR